jgi:hypothetical protein
MQIEFLQNPLANNSDRGKVIAGARENKKEPTNENP